MNPQEPGNRSNFKGILRIQDLSGTPVPVYPSSPCKRCGRPGHFSVVCYVKVDKDGKKIESDSEYNSE